MADFNNESTQMPFFGESKSQTLLNGLDLNNLEKVYHPDFLHKVPNIYGIDTMDI